MAWAAVRAVALAWSVVCTHFAQHHLAILLRPSCVQDTNFPRTHLAPPMRGAAPNASSGYPKNGLVAHRRGACVFMHACPVSKAKHGLRVRQRSYPVADDASARPGCVLCGVCAAGAPPPFAQLRGTFVSILSHLLSGFMERSSITRGPDPGLSRLGA